VSCPVYAGSEEDVRHAVENGVAVGSRQIQGATRFTRWKTVSHPVRAGTVEDVRQAVENGVVLGSRPAHAGLRGRRSPTSNE
jgi:hypothetical protein